MRFTQEQVDAFAAIERRAEAVRKLRALPDAGDILSLAIDHDRQVFVVTGAPGARHPQYCAQCGGPKGERALISVSVDELRVAIDRVISDRREVLEAIALGQSDVPIEPEPVHPPCRSSIEPIEPPSWRAFEMTLYGRENVPAPAEGQVVTFGGAGMEGVAWTITEIASGDVKLTAESYSPREVTIDHYRRFVDSVTQGGNLIWALEDIPF